MRTRRPALTLAAAAALLLSWSGVVEAACMGAAGPASPAAVEEAHAGHDAGTHGAGHAHGGHAPAPRPDDDSGQRLPLGAECPFALGSAGSCLGGFVAAAAPPPTDDLAAALPFPAPTCVRDLLIASALERPPRA